MGPNSLQIAIFFNDIVHRPDKELKSIVENFYNDRLDVMPQINSLPINAPLEIPRVMMNSSKNDLNINISLTRLDIFYKRKIEQATKINGSVDSDDLTETVVDVISDNELESIKQEVVRLVSMISERILISRVGLISNFLIKNDDPIKLIKGKYFCKEIENCKEISLRYNKEYICGTVQCNDIVQIESVKDLLNVENNIQQTITFNGVHILRDFNNVPIENSPLTLENIKTMIKEGFDRFSAKEVNEVL